MKPCGKEGIFFIPRRRCGWSASFREDLRYRESFEPYENRGKGTTKGNGNEGGRSTDESPCQQTGWKQRWNSMEDVIRNVNQRLKWMKVGELILEDLAPRTARLLEIPLGVMQKRRIRALEMDRRLEEREIRRRTVNLLLLLLCDIEQQLWSSRWRRSLRSMQIYRNFSVDSYIYCMKRCSWEGTRKSQPAGVGILDVQHIKTSRHPYGYISTDIFQK